MSKRIERRHFLKTTGALGAGVWLGTGPRLSRAAESPNEKLNLAVIGIGGRGRSNLDGVRSQNIVALCDVDDARAGNAYEKYSKAEKFKDFRKMFDKLESKIDGVVISTPDHTHFHPAYWAMQRDKHVYLEKPLAHTVWEVRELTKLAHEKKLATQLGSQRHTLGGLRNGVELVRAGTIGEIKEVHSWIASGRGMPSSPKGDEKVPAGLDWDLWLGPAAERPFSKAFAPYNWRFWWDFGTGETGNWGCHILDIPYWALDLEHATHVSATGPEPDPEKTPKSLHSTLEFPGNDKRPALKLHWYQGEPPILKELGLSGRGMNNLFIGSEGMLLCGFGDHKLLPEDKFKDTQVPRTFEKSPGFYNEWINACKGGPAATCNFDYSGPMAESVLLANIAYRVQGGFDWNAAKLEAKGNSAAQSMIRDEYRQGWEV